MVKKLVLLYVGEPRAIKESLKQRDKLFKKFESSYKIIESSYLICFIPEAASNNKKRILNNMRFLNEDKYLKFLSIQKRNSLNIYRYILEQKRDVLKNFYYNSKPENITIILLRTDWLFNEETLKLIDLSIKDNIIVSPGTALNNKEESNRKYDIFNDHILIIPSLHLANTLKALEEGIKKSLEYDAKSQRTEHNSVASLHSGNGSLRAGLGPEEFISYGFYKTGLINNHRIIPIKFFYKPSMLNAIPHNIIRKDAHKWMNLSKKQILIKYWSYKKPKIYKKIKKFNPELFQFFRNLIKKIS